MSGGFSDSGWRRFPMDADLGAWLDKIRPAALATRWDPVLSETWLTCQGTWFVGVNALANDGAGRVADSGPLRGAAAQFVRNLPGFQTAPFDQAQVSITYPGFPRRRAGESDASWTFRRVREAAHVDGLHPHGPKRRRKLGEFQGFLLGVPLTEADDKAAPLVIWEGSHRILRAMFQKALAPHRPERWHEVDLTEAYHAARATCFETCRRVVLHAKPGEAYVLHRMALHGVSAWQEGAVAAPDGRAILYFRPEIDRTTWLAAD